MKVWCVKRGEKGLALAVPRTEIDDFVLGGLYDVGEPKLIKKRTK